MALIIICGYPMSCKSDFASKLKEYLDKQDGKNIVLITDSDYMKNKNETYKNLKYEMELRQILKAQTKKLLNEKNIVILDSTNYIKSFRYELFCIAKSLGLKYCVIYCCISEEDVIKINNENTNKYETEILKEIISRFEEPSFKNRWDMPLFVIDPRKKDINLDEIYKTIIVNNKVLTPNIATKNQALPLNYIQDIDKLTQEIIKVL
ncbi:unnamed protein product [Gordionus sp. m RMFG-2023]|uniref:protein KTI12 homolog n=1 Tax=Gordionus sp. m RMFG-2023 TaxID=3053472 RepID=UPI0030E1271A